METIIPFALLCFTSFFTLTNPLGTMPVFLTMTNGLSDDERKHIIKRATIVSFIILIAFTLCGQFLFKFFGIVPVKAVKPCFGLAALADTIRHNGLRHSERKIQN